MVGAGGGIDTSCTDPEQSAQRLSVLAESVEIGGVFAKSSLNRLWGREREKSK